MTKTKRDLFEGVPNPLEKSALFNPAPNLKAETENMKEKKQKEIGSSKDQPAKKTLKISDGPVNLVKTSLLIRRDLHKTLKRHAVEIDENLGDLVNKIIEEYLQKNKVL